MGILSASFEEFYNHIREIIASRTAVDVFNVYSGFNIVPITKEREEENSKLETQTAEKQRHPNATEDLRCCCKKHYGARRTTQVMGRSG